jgi:hypothetical protein
LSWLKAYNGGTGLLISRKEIIVASVPLYNKNTICSNFCGAVTIKDLKKLDV